jgi:hypothetical protein
VAQEIILVQPVHKVGLIEHNGFVTPNHETWFYNILDGYNGDNVHRYDPEGEDDQKVQDLTYQEWATITTRQELVRETFEEFLEALNDSLGENYRYFYMAL